MIINEGILQIIFACGIVYGVVTIIFAFLQRPKKDIYQIVLSISIIAMSVAALFLTTI